ncbi:MAG: hypothetical protein IPO78_01420 [Saprospiraceae bacterium]|nr:hypothetical protein [Saprospiraceae bacterium]
MDKPVVWIAEPDGFSNPAKVLLEANAQVIYQTINPDQIPQILNACDAFWFRLKFTINRSNLVKNQRCKIIITPVTGLDHMDLDACKEMGIKILSLKGETDFLKDVRATAEHTFALMLSLIRKIVPAVNHTLLGNFNRNLFKGTELYNKTLGIIGFGRLGTMVAQYALVFGMKVKFYDIKEISNPGIGKCEFKNLKDLLAESDIVSLHVDLKTENRNMVNQDFLSKMKKNAILINTSRGALIDENALVQYLLSGHVSGAALDVLADEPNVNYDSTLFNYFKTHDNLIITPHIGGNTEESFEKTELFLVQKLMETFSNV